MLGKTRQPEEGSASGTESATTEYVEHYDAVVGKARGVLQSPASPGKFKHLRLAAPPELATWVASFWFTGWEIAGATPHPVETLPHPNFHLVYEAGNWTISGVHTGKFTRTLEGASFAFGIKFTPAGFRPFLKQPASSLANRVIPATELFGDALPPLLHGMTDEQIMVQASTAFLLARAPANDPAVTEVNRIVDRILREPEITTVDKLASTTGLGKRSLQRLFNEYVGAAPKWVIRRYRLHELVERCHSGEELDFAELAVTLGYFDQAHLINDFRSIVGYSPTQYQKIAGTVRTSTARRS